MVRSNKIPLLGRCRNKVIVMEKEGRRGNSFRDKGYGLGARRPIELASPPRKPRISIEFSEIISLPNLRIVGFQMNPPRKITSRRLQEYLADRSRPSRWWDRARPTQRPLSADALHIDWQEAIDPASWVAPPHPPLHKQEEIAGKKKEVCEISTYF